MRCDSMSPFLAIWTCGRVEGDCFDARLPYFLATPCVRCKPLVDTLVDTCSQADCDCIGELLFQFVVACIQRFRNRIKVADCRES